MKGSKAATVDEFIAEVPAETRPAIEEFRKIVKAALPEAEETIAWGKPFFKYHGYIAGVTVYAKWLGVEIIDGLSDEDREALEALGHVCGSKMFRVVYGEQHVPADALSRLVQAQAQAKRNDAKK